MLKEPSRIKKRLFFTCQDKLQFWINSLIASLAFNADCPLPPKMYTITGIVPVGTVMKIGINNVTYELEMQPASRKRHIRRSAIYSVRSLPFYNPADIFIGRLN